MLQNKIIVHSTEERLFEWWHHRISSTDTKVWTALLDSINQSGYESITVTKISYAFLAYPEMVYCTRSNSPKQQFFVLGDAAEKRPNSLCMIV